jgi:hypothetical protein
LAAADQSGPCLIKNGLDQLGDDVVAAPVREVEQSLGLSRDRLYSVTLSRFHCHGIASSVGSAGRLPGGVARVS